MTTRLNAGKVEAVAGRKETLVWSAKIAGSDGQTQEAMAAGDHIRFKIAATAGGTPVLDLNSNAATTAGSIVTIQNRGSASVLASGTVELAAADTSTFSGTKFFELIFEDFSESAGNHDKEICRGTIQFLASQGGNTGMP
jgi:hypothetical protein